jgi:hypothetical protein
MKNNFSSKTLKKGFAPLELVDAMVWEMLRILPKQHPSWVMHRSFACTVPDVAIIEASLARGWATREMQDWFSVPVTVGPQNLGTRPPSPAVRGKKTGGERRQDFLERHSDKVTLMIRDVAEDPEFATAVFFSKSSRGDIFFGREAVEAGIPGIAYINSWRVIIVYVFLTLAEIPTRLRRADGPCIRDHVIEEAMKLIHARAKEGQ